MVRLVNHGDRDDALGRGGMGGSPAPFPRDLRSLFGFLSVTQYSVVTPQLRQVCSPKPGVTDAAAVGLRLILTLLRNESCRVCVLTRCCIKN
jgi:hypothetical protein